MTEPVQDQNDVVIVGAARTPFGKLLGGLSSLPATALGAHAIKAALNDISSEEVDAVILGQVLQAGAGQNPAKQAALAAGIPASAHTVTVNKVCLSGLTAVIDAARLLRSGEARVVIAGGMESMSQAPHLLKNTRAGVKFGDFNAVDHMAYDGLVSAEFGISMGEMTENYSEKWPVTREEQDQIAARSHQGAVAARAELAREIAPVTVKGRKGDTIVELDEGVRENVTAESLSGLRPAFKKDGTITAANASPISDGAAALVLTTRAHAEENNWPIMAVVRAAGQTAGPDASLQEQPANALKAALNRQGWTVQDLDLIEINEAFATVGICSTRALGADPDKVNPHGGAIALGHPIGASGARLATHIAHQIAAGHVRKAGASLCGGGGQGEALLFEAP
ncbi:acetyl-CoA C-acetyltransferase [Corynebacterium epidermidicanis]|uniref:Probable acetyl-CoA acetyltransferase n=1 Tax=Corynebacterium epidermidicanis TaxID=1050174 RepID=A0A0G3GX87_9CORY|nr:acetyl-CoA C-acetyltransferase [Corynebacterium epidermidicanis]AKK04118.1 acetyl-CoA acetyltransferase [Corynebacterium epidermidicanis]